MVLAALGGFQGSRHGYTIKLDLPKPAGSHNPTRTKFHYMYVATVSGTSLKGHNTFDLSIKDKFCSPYKTMAIQFYL